MVSEQPKYVSVQMIEGEFREKLHDYVHRGGNSPARIETAHNIAARSIRCWIKKGPGPSSGSFEMLLSVLELSSEERDEIRALFKRLRMRGNVIEEVTGADHRPLPPLHSFYPSRSNLQPVDGPIVDRVDELDEVLDRLESVEASPITLIGPSGVGKSRLAEEVYAYLVREERHCHWVELEEVSDSARVLPEIARELGVVGGGPLEGDSDSDLPPDLIDRIISSLIAQPAIIFLNNFEQVVGAARQISTLLIRASATKVIATSIEPLGTRGERLIPIRPLYVPDRDSSLDKILASPAVTLFARRMEQRNPRFVVDKTNSHRILEICDLLGGMPQQLEVVAYQSALLGTPKAIVRRLKKHQPMSVASDVFPSRHRSLASPWSWMFGLLRDNQEMVKALAAFEGSFGLDAIDAVLGSHVDPLEVTQQLLNTWLTVDPRLNDDFPRWKMLIPARDYVRLDHWNNDEDRFRELSARYVGEMVAGFRARMETRDRARTLEEFDLQYPNIEATLEWAIRNQEAEFGFSLAAAVWVYWSARFREPAGLGWCARLLELSNAPEVSTIGRAEVLYGAAFLALAVHDLERAKKMQVQMSELPSLAHAPIAEAKAHYLSGELFRNNGNNTGARSELHRARLLFEKAGDRASLALIENNLADIARSESNSVDAKSHAQLALRQWAALRHPWGLAVSCSQSAAISVDLEQPRDGIRFCHHGLHWCAQLNDRSGTAAIIWTLVRALSRLGEQQDAASLLGGWEKYRKGIGIEVLSSGWQRRASEIALVQGGMDNLTFESLREEGRAMNEGQVIEYARNLARHWRNRSANSDVSVLRLNDRRDAY